MKLAILFWFYKDFQLCAERVALLRRLNPKTPIYGLYGGPPPDLNEARRSVGGDLDDLWAYAADQESHWRWLHGDQLIAAWMRERGQALEWDTVVVIQWDMLVLAPVDDIFAGLGPGEAVFSGHRPLDEVREWWGWAGAQDGEKRAALARFEDRLAEDFDYQGPLWCCLFIVICLPRDFLARYAAYGPPEEGFLEYRMPTLARIWGTPVRTDLGGRPWWGADPSTKTVSTRARALNAVGQEASLELVVAESRRPNGLRIFHPYTGPPPPGFESAAPDRLDPPSSGLAPSQPSPDADRTAPPLRPRLDGAPRVCAITNVLDEDFNLPIWLRYYGRELGPENCIVVDRGSTSLPPMTTQSLLQTHRSPFDDGQRSRGMADLTAMMLEHYDVVIYTDCDEYLVPDPNRFDGLVDYFSRTDQRVYTAAGIDLYHKLDVEDPIDPSRPLLGQRAYGLYNSWLCKTLATRDPIRWSGGFHAASVPPSWDGLYLFHTAMIDCGERLKRAAQLRRFEVTDVESAPHHRYPPIWPVNVLVKTSGFDVHDFDAEVPGLTERALSSAEQADDGLYYVTDEVRTRYLLRVPERFREAF